MVSSKVHGGLILKTQRIFQEIVKALEKTAMSHF